MGILDSIEKLITEHGSAAILKERIALANDKFSALETEKAVLAKENVSLNAEKSILADKNKRLEVDNKQLRQKIQNLELENETLKQIQLSHSDSPKNEKEKILIALSNKDMDGSEIVKITALKRTFAEIHIHELESIGLIKEAPLSLSFGDSPFSGTWQLTHKGRKFIIENGLIK